MKSTIKTLALMLILTSPMFFFASCSDDDEDEFNYPMEYIYGTWDLTSIEINDGWVDVTKWPYTQFGASATFNKNGTYSGDGYFGEGSGTWKAKGNILITYIDGKEYLRYTVSSLTSTNMEGSISDSSGLLNIKAKKR